MKVSITKKEETMKESELSPQEIVESEAGMS